MFLFVLTLTGVTLIFHRWLEQEAFPHINTNMQIKFSCLLNESNFRHPSLFFIICEFALTISMSCRFFSESLSGCQFKIPTFHSAHILFLIYLRCMGQIKRQMNLKREMYVRMYSIYSFLF